MTLKAVIFDVDGTLAETEELHRAAFNAAFAEAGLDWSWDRDRYFELLAVEGGLARMRHYAETHRPRDLTTMEHAGDFERLHERKQALFVSMIEEGAALRPGVARLIEDLRSSGIKLAACTTSTRETFEALILNAFGIDALDWFAAVVTREDVETVLQPGMVVSMEPIIMIPEGMPGAGGYREHDILVITEDGNENITGYPYGPEFNVVG